MIQTSKQMVRPTRKTYVYHSQLKNKSLKEFEAGVTPNDIMGRFLV